MYVAILVHTKVGACCGQGREGKEEQQGKVSPQIIGSYGKSLSGRHVPSPVSSSTTLCTPVAIAMCPADVISVRDH